MTNETKQLIEQLKENGEDFEFYPTTQEMVNCIYNYLKVYDDYCYSFLDIGCGTENFRKYMTNAHDARESNRLHIGKYYVMEKSRILLSKLDKDTICLGTDFMNQTLIDKRVDLIFSNPVYSQYKEWTLKILNEGNCNYVVLIIPQRWKEDREITDMLEKVSNKYQVIGSFDFLHAERNARAYVDILFVEMKASRYDESSSFDRWFDETFTMEDREKEDKYFSEVKENVKNQIVEGENAVDRLVTLYNAEMDKLFEHFKAITSLDADTLKDIGIHKDSVKEALKKKMTGLKTLYWQIAIDYCSEITDRLTSKTREDIFNRFKELQAIDFTYENVYSLVIWVIKNANSYFDEQLISFFKNLSSFENCKPYKSNQRFGTDRWRFAEENNHYTLDYRIVCDRWVFNMSNDSSWNPGINEYKAKSVICDVCTIANNLGFKIGYKGIPSCFGEKITISFASDYESKDRVFCEYKAYKNGNVHFKFNKEFMKALNVEASRLLGWINNVSDIAKEFDPEMAEGAEKYFKANAYLPLNSNVKLISA